VFGCGAPGQGVVEPWIPAGCWIHLVPTITNTHDTQTNTHTNKHKQIMNIANTNATSQLYETTHFANYKIKLVRQGEGGRNRGRRERESDKEGLR